MAEFWIRRHGSGDVRGPVTSAQLKALAKMGNLTPEDEIGKSEEGPWNQAAKIKGLEFAVHFQDSDAARAQYQEDAEPPEASYEEDEDEVVEEAVYEEEPEGAPVFINVHSEPYQAEQPALVTAPPGAAPRSRAARSNPDNKYPALKIIVAIQTGLGWISLGLCALALLGWCYFLISSMFSGSSVSEEEVENRMVFFRDMGINMDRDAVREELEKQQGDSVGIIAGSFAYWFVMGSTAFAALYFFAFAQIITLFMDIERNTRSG